MPELGLHLKANDGHHEEGWTLFCVQKRCKQKEIPWRKSIKVALHCFQLASPLASTIAFIVLVKLGGPKANEVVVVDPITKPKRRGKEL